MARSLDYSQTVATLESWIGRTLLFTAIPQGLDTNISSLTTVGALARAVEEPWVAAGEVQGYTIGDHSSITICSESFGTSLLDEGEMGDLLHLRVNQGMAISISSLPSTTEP